MTITFPRSLPNIKFMAARFALNDSVTASPSGAGQINYTQTDDPVWTIDFQSVGLVESDLATLTAWWASLRGGLRSAQVTQNVTCRPKAHADPANAAPAQGHGFITSITNGNEVAFDGVSSDLVLTPGDLVQFSFGQNGLGRITEASGTGTERTIVVEPPLRSYVAKVGAWVIFENPYLFMRPVPKSWSVGSGPLPQVSFQLVESPS